MIERHTRAAGGSAAPTLYFGSSFTAGPVVETDLAGTIKAEYVYFGGKRIARRDYPCALTPPECARYHFSDHLNSTNLVYSASGTLEEQSDFYPYGGERAYVAGPNHFKFTGKERDAESGLDYFGARYYTNSLGRFLTPDWADKPTAVPYAEFGDPQSLNLYSYALNQPVFRTDPDGHDVWDVVRGVSNAIVHDFTLGASPRGTGNADYKLGQAIGDAVATVAGTIQALEGATVAIAGAGFSGTGAGAVVGAPAAVAGAALGAHGAATATIGFTYLAKAAGEPPQLKAGKQAHKEEPVRAGEQAEVVTPSGKRMDRYDADKAHIREIKPNNKRGIKDGEKKLKMYKAEMDKATKRKHTTELTLYDKKKRKRR